MIKEKICAGVYRVEIPIPYDFKRINCYVIDGQYGLTIIDTGDYTEAAIQVWKEIIGDNIVKRVVITHAHPDHFGLASWFQQHYGATITMSKETKEQFLLRKVSLTSAPFHGTSFRFLADYGFEHGEGEDVFNRIEAYNFVPDETFEAGEDVRIGDFNAQSIATPGHAIDHMCFYIPQNGCLFIGDHLLGERSTIVMPHEDMENPLALYIPSFKKLMALDVRHTLPGHGIVIVDLQQRIQQVLTRYENRWHQILTEIKQAEKNARELTEILYADAHVEYRNAALLQTITHLNYLVSKGKVQKVKRQGIWTFCEV